MVLKFDQIGYWSQIKLDIIKKHAQAYTRVFSQKYGYFNYAYIDAFAGSGTHISRSTKEEILGSPRIALGLKPPFKEYYFIDTDGDKVAELKRLAAGLSNVHIFEGDCNSRLLNDVFPNIEYEKYKRAFCLLDPYGLDLDWNVVQTAGKMGSIEIIINFPVMDMNRNVLWRNPEGVDPVDVDRMNRFWGDDSWKGAAYRVVPNLFGDSIEYKESNTVIAQAYGQRLKEVAGFSMVPDPLPMRNSKGAIIYYLFFASPNPTGAGIITNIFNKYRERGIR